MARGGSDSSEARRTRREFVRDAGGAAVGAAAISLPGVTSAFARRRRRRQTVAIFGGGVAGLTAAHELAERGFDVTVYERRAWGGKARSTEVPGTAKGGRRPLPSEHGFRVVFGFYHNLPDTLRRIPFRSNPNGVFDNMVPASIWRLARAGGGDIIIPVRMGGAEHYTVDHLISELMFALGADLPPAALARFGQCLSIYFSSCEARRRGQWENTAWTDFIEADRYGGDYKKFLGELPRLVQASNAATTSVNWIAGAVEPILYCIAGRGGTGPFDRPLNGPTNETWIVPWTRHLRQLGVQLEGGKEVTKLEFRGGRIAGAELHGPKGRHRVEADWYVVALPVEAARRLWSPELLDSDRRLAPMRKLRTDWMTGLQFFLREPVPIINGHAGYLDAPWAITSISQAQFWARDMPAQYGDGQVRDCLSAIISSWHVPGALSGKQAAELPPRQVAREVWEEIKRHVDASGQGNLTDDVVHSWTLDPGMVRRNGRYHNQDPLTVPTVGTHRHRPEAGGAVENLILAGDYLKLHSLVGTMEGANEAGRRAANVVLERANSRESPAAVFTPYQPPEWEPFKRIDEDRYQRGEPNLFDAEMSEAEFRRRLSLMA